MHAAKKQRAFGPSSWAALAGLLLAGGSVASATPIPGVSDLNSNGRIDLADVISTGSFTILDKQFSTFSYTPTSSAPPASDISVDVAPGADIGLRFIYAWNSINGLNMDSRIDYRVDVIDPDPTVLIDKVGLNFQASSSGTAVGLVSETVTDLSANHLLDLSVTTSPNVANVLLPLSPPQRSILVDKDIQVFSAPNQGGGDNTSQITFVDNTYHQIPEPAFLGVLAAGAGILGLRFRRK